MRGLDTSVCTLTHMFVYKKTQNVAPPTPGGWSPLAQHRTLAMTATFNTRYYLIHTPDTQHTGLVPLKLATLT